MAKHAVLRPAVESLLEALEIRPKEFLPADSDPPHPFIPRPDFNRGYAYEVLKGEKPLTVKMARKLRKRLQLLLEYAIDDREELERIIAERAMYERAAAERGPVLQMLLGAAIRERSAPAVKITARRDALRQIKAQHSVRGRVNQILFLEILDRIIAERQRRGNVAQLRQRLLTLCQAYDSLLVSNKGRYDIADVRTILRLFGPAAGKEAGRPDREGPDRRETVIEVSWNESPESFPREHLLRFAEILRNRGFEVFEVERAQEGCTTITLRVRAEGLETIQGVIGQDQLSQMGILSLREEHAERKNDLGSGKIMEPPQGLMIVKERDVPIERQLRNALRREAMVRPWRRLHSVFLPAVARTSQWLTIAESDDRAYAHPLISRNWSALRVDLGMTLLWWPLVTVLALILVLVPMPAHAVTMGILCGMALAMAGAQPCSLLVSPLACGAGILAMSFPFAVVQTMILAHMNTEALLSRPRIIEALFLSIDGGLLGLSAPEWHSVFSWGLIAVMIFGIALSITIAGWLMGQPPRARQRVNHYSFREEIGGTLLGAAAGSGIGLVYALDRLFRSWLPQPFAFLLGFSLVGGTWIGLSTYLRFSGGEQAKRRNRAVLTAIVHAILAAGLSLAVFWSAGTPAGPVFLAACCGFFQSTFFTAAFVIAQKIGGPRAAFGATTLEGAVGFALFVVARVLGLS